MTKVAKKLVITLDSRLLIFYYVTMFISERQGKILKKVVEEHINSARPVSSKLIEEKYGFSVCPATIRNDMQILTDLGISKIKLMTNNPKKIVGLEGYGLEIVERVDIEVASTCQNVFYMQTKKDKMGHILNLEQIQQKEKDSGKNN